MTFYKVFAKGRIRFETIYLAEAQAYARRIWKREDVLPIIEEWTND